MMKFMVTEISPNYVEVWEFEAVDLEEATRRVNNRLTQYYKKIDIDTRSKDYTIFAIDNSFDRGFVHYRVQEC